MQVLCIYYSSWEWGCHPHVCLRVHLITQVFLPLDHGHIIMSFIGSSMNTSSPMHTIHHLVRWVAPCLQQPDYFLLVTEGIETELCQKTRKYNFSLQQNRIHCQALRCMNVDILPQVKRQIAQFVFTIQFQHGFLRQMKLIRYAVSAGKGLHTRYILFY